VLAGIRLQTAVLVLAIAGFVQSWHMFALLRRDVDRRRLGAMLLFAGAGLPLGRLAAGRLPEPILLAALGAVLIAAGLSQLLRFRAVERVLSPRPVLSGLLFAGGIIHGAFASGGATVVVYASRTFAEKESFRATLTAFWAILNTALLALMAGRAPVSPDAGPLLLIALPLVIAGNLIGQRLARRLSRERFRTLVDVLLVIAGAAALVRALA